MVPGGAADADGRLQAGDQLLKVDGQSLIGITQERAADYLVRTGPIVTLEVAKQGAIYHGLATLLQQPSPVIQRGKKSFSVVFFFGDQFGRCKTMGFWNFCMARKYLLRTFTSHYTVKSNPTIILIFLRKLFFVFGKHLRIACQKNSKDPSSNRTANNYILTIHKKLLNNLTLLHSKFFLETT